MSQDEIDSLDVGDPPKNYKRQEVIDTWRINQRDKVAHDPAQLLFTGVPADCSLNTEDGTIITDEPLVILEFINLVILQGAIVLGFDAPQRLKALAAWAVTEGEGHKTRLVAWRQSIGPVKSWHWALSDPIDFIVGAGNSVANGGRFLRAMGLEYPARRTAEEQILDIKKIVDTLLDRSLTESYQEIIGGPNND
jgi:hypothetical protein